MPCATCESLGLSSEGVCADCAHTPPDEQCSACGAKLFPDARFCARCGRQAVRAGLNATSSHAILRSNVSPRMAERVLQQGSAMVGERKRVTVLFADIRGSTALIDDLDPEEAMAALAPIMQILMDVVHAHDGLVNQTRGDGIMALFGAPLANENHAVDACAAALGMRTAVEALARSSGRTEELRIGLNSGEVIIQSIGSDLSMNFDAVGRTVNLAARLEQQAQPGTILVSEDTESLVRGFMRSKSVGTMDLKGVGQPLSVFELEAAHDVTRWQARKAQGLSAFAGRSRELGALTAACAAVEAGTGRLVSITASPGLGKSRLVEELIERLPTSWHVLQATCSAQRASTSYHPLAQLLQLQFGITAETRPADVRDRLSTFIATRDPALTPYIPAMLSILDVRSPDEAWTRLDPGERRVKVTEAMRAGVASRSSTRPLLIVIEDVHWCDPETRHILESIGSAIGPMRLLLVLTQRPETTALRIPATVPVTYVNLEPLDTGASQDLAQALLGSDISLAPLTARILDLADGNPLFIEELVQDLRGSGKLNGTPGNYRLAASPRDLRLPDSIHTVIAARIDQLEADPKAILQTAAVIGRQAPVAILAHMLDREAASLVAPLARLQTAGLLFVNPGQASYLFKHELIRDVAYRTLLLETRRAMHAKAVEFIETAYADRLEEHIDRLADHAFEAHLWAKALPYQMRSCRRALRRGANHEAISICERAASALERLPDSPDGTKAQIDFTLAEILALEPLGRHGRIVALLRTASRKAEDLKDPWRVAAVNCQLVVALWRTGEHVQAMQAAEAAEAAAASVGDSALMFAARHNRGIVHHETGDFDKAIAALRGCLAMETPEIDVKRVGWAALPSVVLRTFLADSLLETGEITEADAIAEEASARAEAAGHAYSRVQINQVRAHIRIAQGRAGEVLTMLEKDWRASIDLEMIQMHPIIATRLGQAHLERGNVRAAIEILAQPDRLDVPLTENAFGWRYLFLTRGRAYLEIGRIEDARACGERALAMAKARGERPQEAYANALLADIANAEGRRRVALTHMQEALRLSQACGMRPLAARCRAGIEGNRLTVRSTLRALLRLPMTLRRRAGAGH